MTWTLATFVMQFGAQGGGQGTFEKTIGDAQIASAITAELSEVNGGRADDIQAACVNGIVTLQGVVDSLADKRRAVAVATTIRGVRAIVDRLSLRPSDLDDGEITAQITQALRDDPVIDQWQIVVGVDQGVVTLRGQVVSYVAKILGKQIVADVRGVKRVVNDLAVEQAGVRSNDEIQREVEQRIKKDIWLIDPDVRATVDDGQVKTQMDHLARHGFARSLC